MSKYVLACWKVCFRQIKSSAEEENMRRIESFFFFVAEVDDVLRYLIKREIIVLKRKMDTEFLQQSLQKST